MKHIHLESCNSTFEELKSNMGGLALLVSCDKQLKGRGRGDNLWDTFTHSLAMSFTAEPHSTPTLTALEIGILIVQFFKKELQIDLELKWPNDIIKNGKKVGGLLIQGHEGKLLVGIGLNLFMTDKESFGSYKVSGGYIFDKIPLLSKKELAFKLTTYIQDNRVNSSQEVMTKFLENCYHKNSRVEIYDGDNIEGNFIGINKDGAAIIKNTEQTKEVYSGSLRIL